MVYYADVTYEVPSIVEPSKKTQRDTRLDLRPPTGEEPVAWVIGQAVRAFTDQGFNVLEVRILEAH